MHYSKTTPLFIGAYIIRYFSNLLTKDELSAHTHFQTSYSLGFAIDESSFRIKKMYEKGWLSSDPTVLTLLKDGYETFELNVANRVINETPEKVFFNNCARCRELARTPYARQCRFCSNNWHHIIQAKFAMKKTIQITKRGFYIIGKVTNGDLNTGNYLDLTPLGLNARPKIENIEFTLKRQGGIAIEDFALKISQLSAEQQEYVVKIGSSNILLDILNDL